MDEFCLVVYFHWEGSATNGTTLYSICSLYLTKYQLFKFSIALRLHIKRSNVISRRTQLYHYNYTFSMATIWRMLGIKDIDKSYTKIFFGFCGAEELHWRAYLSV